MNCEDTMPCGRFAYENGSPILTGSNICGGKRQDLDRWTKIFDRGGTGLSKLNIGLTTIDGGWTNFSHHHESFCGRGEDPWPSRFLPFQRELDWYQPRNRGIRIGVILEISISAFKRDGNNSSKKARPSF